MKNKFHFFQKGNRILAMLMVMIFFFTSVAFAQQQSLRGKVSSSTGDALIGATVSVIGYTLRSNSFTVIEKYYPMPADEAALNPNIK